MKSEELIEWLNWLKQINQLNHFICLIWKLRLV